MSSETPANSPEPEEAAEASEADERNEGDDAPTLSESDAGTSPASTPNERDAAEPGSERMSVGMRHGGWMTARGILRTFGMGFLSVLLHIVLLIVILLLNLRTNIQMEIEWSDDATQGIGDASIEAMTTANVEATSEPVLSEGASRKVEKGESEPKPEPKPEPEPKQEEVEPEPEPEPESEPEPDRDERQEVMAAEAEPDTDDDTDEKVARLEPEPEPEPESQPEPESPPTEPTESVEIVDPGADDAVEKQAKSVAGAIIKGAKQAGAPKKGEKDQRGHVAEALPVLADFGPGNSRLIVLVRTDRIRDTDFEPAVRGLLEKFPHYQVSLGKSAIDPVETVQAFLVATPNPRSYADTFLAVRHSVENRILKVAMRHSYPGGLKWSEYEGHPLGRPVGKKEPGERLWKGPLQQNVYLPQEGLAIYLRPELLPTLNQPPPIDPLEDGEDADDQDPDDVGPLGEDGEPLVQRTLLETLTAIEEVDGADETVPAVFITVKNIKSLTFGGGLPSLPAPIALTGSVTPGDMTRLVLRFEYEKESEATDFMNTWPDFVTAVEALRVPGVGGMARAINFEQDGPRVYGDGEVNGVLVKLLIGFVTAALPDIEDK